MHRLLAELAHRLRPIAEGLSILRGSPFSPKAQRSRRQPRTFGVFGAPESEARSSAERPAGAFRSLMCHIGVSLVVRSCSFLFVAMALIPCKGAP